VAGAGAVIAAAGAGCAGSAVNSVAVEARLLDGVGVIDARGMAVAARVWLPHALESLGFCVAPAAAAQLRLRLRTADGATEADALPLSSTAVLIDIVDPAAAGVTSVRPSAAHRQQLLYFCEAHGKWGCAVSHAYLHMLLRWATFYMLFSHAAPAGGLLTSHAIATFLYREGSAFDALSSSTGAKGRGPPRGGV